MTEEPAHLQDLSVVGSGTMDIELVWKGRTVRVQHPAGVDWFTLYVLDGAREQAAVRLPVEMARHIAELMLDVASRA